MNQISPLKHDYKISVVMTVCQYDDAGDFEMAVESILNQTYQASEIIIVVDGVVSQEIETLLQKYESNTQFKIIRLPENVGLGLALQKGCTEAQYPLIARMDSDDVSEPTRFAKQINYFLQNKDCDVVGTFGVKFFDNLENIYAKQKLPIGNLEIRKIIKKRNPLNHMSVMMKKDMLMKSGNYQDWYLAEDYYLWVRMCLKGAVFYNIPENLVNIRVNDKTFTRRHGMKYFKSLKQLFKFMLANKLIGRWTYWKNIFVRFIYHVLIPRYLKKMIYRKF